MDYSKENLKQLKALCEERGIEKYKSENKPQLVELLKSDDKKQAETNAVAQAPPTDWKMIDLFAGTGAFTRAFENTGRVKCVFSNDMVEPSKQIYDFNFNHELTLANLNDIDVETIPKHDILTGGFPCQPFSIAGKREGFQDERSNVFWKILEIIDKHEPACVILENVKNLVTHDEKRTFETIKAELEKRNYHIRYKILNKSDIIIGHNTLDLSNDILKLVNKKINDIKLQ